EEERFDAADSLRAAGVRVDRNKEIRLLLVCECGPFLERNKRVVTARQNHFRTHFRFDQGLETFCHIQNEVFLSIAGRTDTAGVVSAMACVDDYATHL